MAKMFSRNLLLFLFVTLVGCREQILHNLSEQEANLVLSELHTLELTPQKVRQADGQWAIAVPKTSALPAIQHLSQTRVWRNSRNTEAPRSKMIPSREEVRFQYERALSAELERTILTAEGVIDARVHLNLPTKDPLFGRTLNEEKGGSASALIITTTRSTLQREEVRGIIAGASGIEHKAIDVLLSQANALDEDLYPLPKLPTIETSPESPSLIGDLLGKSLKLSTREDLGLLAKSFTMIPLFFVSIVFLWKKVVLKKAKLRALQDRV